MAFPAYAGHFTVDSLGDVDDGQPYTAGDGTNTLNKCIRLAHEFYEEENLVDFSISGTFGGFVLHQVEIWDGNGLIGMYEVSITVDASSQWQGVWPGGQPGVTIDGPIEMYQAGECCLRGLYITNAESLFWPGCSNKTIGGTGPGQRNIIPGGINIDCSTKNKILGNYIGTDVTGTVAIGDTPSGIHISNPWDNSGSNIIEGNVIAGGISLEHTSGNIISGNYIGVDATGTAKLGNDGDGIFIGCETKSNIIEGNVISGNGNGIYLHCQSDYSESLSSADNKIYGNYIGTDATGTVALGNGSGITIGERVNSTIIGGTKASERNVISGNGVGISFIRESNYGVNGGGTIIGNYIGTDATGTAELGNGTGISLSDVYGGANIGGKAEGEGNVISGNHGSGISLYCYSYPMQCGVSAAIFNNYIGTDATKTINLGNGGSGISLGGKGVMGTIDGNVIAYNSYGIGFDIEAYIMYANFGLPEILDNSIYQNVNGDTYIPCLEYIEVSVPTITLCKLAGSFLMLEADGSCSISEACKIDLFKYTDMTYLGRLLASEYGGFSGSIDVSGKGLSVGNYIVAKASGQSSYFCYFSDFSEPVIVSPATGQCCELKAGWNLISFAVSKCFYEDEEPSGLPSCVEPVNINTFEYNSLAEWFSSVIKPGDAWEMVIGTNGVMGRTSPPGSHTLKYMSPGSGYWVNINNKVSVTPNLCIEGQLFDPADPDCFIPLEEGWNLVGYPLRVGYYDDGHPDISGVEKWIKVNPPVIKHVFEHIAGKYSIIIGEFGAYSFDFMPQFSSLHYIAPCQAFWIKMEESADLRYPSE